MTCYKNKNYIGEIDPECTNVIACVAPQAPNDNWEQCDEIILCNLTALWIENGVQYYGYL